MLDWFKNYLTKMFKVNGVLIQDFVFGQHCFKFIKFILVMLSIKVP